MLSSDARPGSSNLGLLKFIAPFVFACFHFSHASLLFSSCKQSDVTQPLSRDLGLVQVGFTSNPKNTNFETKFSDLPFFKNLSNFAKIFYGTYSNIFLKKKSRSCAL